MALYTLMFEIYFTFFSFQQCDPEKMITESKFLQLESLQELIKVIHVYIIIVINTMSLTSHELVSVIINE